VNDPLSILSLDALQAAPGILGHKLMSRLAGQVTGGIIIEVEAYHGAEDPASHAYRGLTERTAPMFEEAGTIYVYRSYGLHYCANLVTGGQGEAQAVLLRALWPTNGLPIMTSRRGHVPPARLANGPANLTQALGISLTQTGSRLGEDLWLEPPATRIDPASIITGPRVGITRARELPWRFRLSQGAIQGTMSE
jgi:DNA-3-methyladenine glycosylase